MSAMGDECCAGRVAKCGFAPLCRAELCRFG
jgi:hypothetical protein